jgi:hypothetical protein
MALQWATGTAPQFAPTNPMTFEVTGTRANLTTVTMRFSVNFEWNPDEPPTVSEEEAIGWIQPIYDGFQNAGWSVTQIKQQSSGSTERVIKVV